MGRHLHIGISRLNRAIADYSLARLEFTLCYPDVAEPPLLARLGGPTSGPGQLGSWATTMKRIANLNRYIDEMRGANLALDRDPVFDRVAKAAHQVVVLAWNFETMHRRSGGSTS